MKKRHRKMIGFASLIGVVVLVIAACGGGDPTAVPPTATTVAPTATTAPAPSPATPAPTATPEPVVPEPRRGGTLVAVQHLNARGLDPMLNVCPGTCAPIRPMYDKLVELSKFDGATAVPDLAESWNISGDGKIFTFNLRQGVKFHDGSDFTAEDVVYSVFRAQNPEKFEEMGAPRNLRDSNLVDNFSIVNNVEAIDPFTVRFTLDKFSDKWFNSLLEVRFTLYIIPSDKPYEEQLAEGTGTGAYVFDENVPDEKFTLKANPNYWKTDPDGNQLPFLDAIEIFIINDNSALLAAFTSGRALWERPVSANRVAGRAEELAGQIPGFQMAGLASTLHSLVFNNRNPILKDIRFRQAVDLALNRHAVNELAFGSAGIVFHGVGIPPELNGGGWGLDPKIFEDRPGYHKDPVKRAEDVENAQALMRELGFGPDNPLKLLFLARTSSQEEMTVVLDSLRDIWIETTSEGLVVPGRNETAELESKNWDVLYFFLLAGSPYPGFQMRAEFSSVRNDSGWFTEDWDYSFVDPLWDQFDATSDRAVQQRIAEQIQELMLEKLYFVPMFRSAIFHSWWPALRNMPRTQCCTVADVVEDMEALWIDRDFTPFGTKTEGDVGNFMRPG